MAKYDSQFERYGDDWDASATTIADADTGRFTDVEDEDDEGLEADLENVANSAFGEDLGRGDDDGERDDKKGGGDDDKKGGGDDDKEDRGEDEKEGEKKGDEKEEVKDGKETEAKRRKSSAVSVVGRRGSAETEIEIHTDEEDDYTDTEEGGVDIGKGQGSSEIVGVVSGDMSG